jgi:methionine biosynthesis protein MetW
MAKYETNEMHEGLAIKKIFDWVEPRTKVLDVGCSTGFLGERLKKEKGCTVHGIEIDKESCMTASKRIDKVICADIERQDINTEKNYYDCIIFADILEHTSNPEEVLEKFTRYLKRDGSVFVSLPNVAHPLVRLKLLFGGWNYTKYGILDDMHLRFFTYKTARQLLESAGLKINAEKFTGKLRFKKAFSSQFVFKCSVK